VEVVEALLILPLARNCNSSLILDRSNRPVTAIVGNQISSKIFVTCDVQWSPCLCSVVVAPHRLPCCQKKLQRRTWENIRPSSHCGHAMKFVCNAEDWWEEDHGPHLQQ
jgi:hypothetical protein